MKIVDSRIMVNMTGRSFKCISKHSAIAGSEVFEEGKIYSELILDSSGWNLIGLSDKSTILLMVDGCTIYVESENFKLERNIPAELFRILITQN